MVTVRAMMSLEDPQAERGGKKDNETTQKRGRCWKYAISVQDAGGDDGGGKASVIWDTMSCRVKVRGIQVGLEH